MLTKPWPLGEGCLAPSCTTAAREPGGAGVLWPDKKPAGCGTDLAPHCPGQPQHRGNAQPQREPCISPFHQHKRKPPSNSWSGATLIFSEGAQSADTGLPGLLCELAGCVTAPDYTELRKNRDGKAPWRSFSAAIIPKAGSIFPSSFLADRNREEPRNGTSGNWGRLRVTMKARLLRSERECAYSRKPCHKSSIKNLTLPLF